MTKTAPHVDPELLSTLPAVLRAVVAALGFVRAQAFLLEYGGVNVNIPNYKSTALKLSPAELTRLRENLAPHMDALGRVSMPKADKLLILVRNAQIRKERDNVSINKQARRYNLSARQILNIRRDDDDRQFNLF